MKTQVSIIALISMMVSLTQPAWSMEEEENSQGTQYQGQKQPEKKKEKETEKGTDEGEGKEGKEATFDALHNVSLRYGGQRKSKFRREPGFEKAWETLDLLDAAKTGVLPGAEGDHFFHLVARGFFPRETLTDIDFATLLMSQSPENWSDDKIIMAALKLPYSTTVKRDLAPLSEGETVNSLLTRFAQTSFPH
ncbi:MAG: hypothetical protein BGO67_06860 [Alphaproteobacteria bacterium 41-28]|nr:MAG: hypothetical protein BGO67_06860 [Alphaproteobacteria bacterium 41-28]